LPVLSLSKPLIGHPNAFAEEFSFIFFSLPFEGGSAWVPCQINDLAGWVREGVLSKGIFQQRDFLGKSIFESNPPHPNPLPSRERGKEKGLIRGKTFPL